MAFKIGDMVVRTSGSWMRVNEGDIKKVSWVHGRNIRLEGHPDITFDSDNFKLDHRTSVQLEEFQRGHIVTYRYRDGEVYTGRVQDTSQTKLGVIRNSSGEYDAVNKTDVIVTGEDRPFKIGDRVRMISEEPAYGAGEVKVGDIGMIVRTSGDDFVVDFPNQDDWDAHVDDIEHVAEQKVTTTPEPEVSLDEAVSNWQNVNQQIKELEAQAANYIRVMRRAGLKPV
jgi:hypothetical protein